MFSTTPPDSVQYQPIEINRTTSLPRIMRVLEGRGYGIQGGVTGSLISMSPDGDCLLYKRPQNHEFVTRDPSRSRSYKVGNQSARMICGDQYMGLLIIGKEMYPWILTSRGVDVGQPLESKHEAWGKVLASGSNTYLAQDGRHVARIVARSDGASLRRGAEFSPQLRWTSAREYPLNGFTVFQGKNEIVVSAALSTSAPISRGVESWTISRVSELFNLRRLAVSEQLYSACGLGKPLVTGSVCTVPIYLWEIGGGIFETSISIPARRGISVAVSPIGDKIALIGEFAEGENSDYLVNVWTLPSLRPIGSQIFESPMTEDAEVEFGSKGQILIVSSPSRRTVWTFDRDGDAGFYNQGTYCSEAPLKLGLLARNSETLVIQEREGSGPDLVDRFKWMDLGSHKMPGVGFS